MFLENAWYAAAWSREVRGGELFERTIAGRSLLFLRRTDGGAVALGNACPHRFADIEEMQGIALASGAGANRCRRVLRELRRAEAGGAAPRPALVPLAERRDYARTHTERLWPVV